nr:MAG TPA: Structural protein [Caudoviricetes sp.]
MHYGVKGMRKGTRKSREERNAERRAKYEARLKAKYGDHDIKMIEDHIKKRKALAEKVKNFRLANQRNRQLTATERREKYYNELDRGQLGKTYSTDVTLAEAARRYYKKGSNKRMGHSELMHYGVKGMKWGVRRRARRDAKEYTMARMYYGEGAGNRRKLIKATVKARSKDPFYKSEFDKAVSKTDMSKRASQAQRQRGRKNARNATGKTVRGVGNIASGNVSRAGGALALTYLGYQGAKRAGVVPNERELLTKAAKGARKIKRVVQHDDVLAHYGIKGMRWGVRKSRIKGAKRWSSSKQAKIDGMSDDQLRRINNRIRLEKEYRQLTQTRMERYRSKAGKAAEEAAFNTLQGILQKGLKKAASQGGSAAIKGAKRFK